MSDGMQTIMIVEDEESFVEALTVGLRREGFRVLVARDGAEAITVFETGRPDLVLLDVMLPRVSGIDVCRHIRGLGGVLGSVPIIMVTAKSGEIDTVVGLEVGADDYITKPFSADELLARVDAVLRRAGSAYGSSLATTFESGDLHIDFAAHRVTVKGDLVELSAGEYRLLVELATNSGRVLLQDELLGRVWGPDYIGATALLQTAIRRLRRKIEEDPSSPRHVLTKRGVGYQFAKR